MNHRDSTPQPESRAIAARRALAAWIQHRLASVRVRMRGIGRRRALVGAGVVVALVALGVVLLVARPQAEGPVARPSTQPPSPTPRPTAAASVEPSAPPEEWAALDLPDYEPLATLVSNEADGSGISTTAGFTFQTLNGAPAVELAGGLVVEPPVELAVEPGSSPDVAAVRPTQPLVENARYDVRLYDPDGALVGSWSFRTGGPLRVIRWLPDDHTTGVPVDTGIEIEFNQDGAMGVEEHLSIEPAVSGSVEAHGRTWVFVPDGPLTPATLYTVTLSAGVGVAESDQVLGETVQFAFETAAPTDQSSGRVWFERTIHEASPDEAPVIPVHAWADSQAAMTRRVTVHALPTLPDALDAARTVAVDQTWAWSSANGAVPTSGLAEVASFDVDVSLDGTRQYVALPTGFAAGWYLVSIQQEGRPAQLLLQVTDLAAYVLASPTRTVAWVNDVPTQAPLAGAALEIPGGDALGETDSGGLLDVPTPAGLVEGRDPAAGAALLLVSADDGRRVIAPLDSNQPRYWGGPVDSEWWLLFGTDRSMYRADDTVHASGMIRSRADRSVPTGLELRLVAGFDPQSPPLVRLPVTATGRGVIAGDLAFTDLAPGQYTVGLYVGDDLVGESWITVTDIRKPAFQIDVETDRKAYISGETVELTAGATFFDGSTAPGLELAVSASSGVDQTGERTLTADRSGTARTTYRAATTGASMEWGSAYVAPATPEEGGSSGTTGFVVFASTAWITAEATIDDAGVTVTGRLNAVDLAAAAQQVVEDGWVRDPSGAPLAGQSLTVLVDRVTWIPVQRGTTYDFLEKRTVPVYDYERQVDSLGSYAPTTAGDGSFALVVPADVGTGGVEVRLSATDAEGRVVELTAWAERAAPDPVASDYPYLEGVSSGCGWSTMQRTAGIGEEVILTVRTRDGAPSAEGRTLFLVGRQGLEEVVVTTGAELVRTFADADLPSLSVRAVRLTPAGYIEMDDVIVAVDAEAKAIDVQLAGDRDRYEPGNEVTVSITTIGPDGYPVPADVIVQAVDMKLYAMGVAGGLDTTRLMAPVASGFAASYASHRVPPPFFEGGCGATTGGGGEPREDFRDVATFQVVSTDAAGRGSATFTAPDDLTTWVVAATAVGDALEAGEATLHVPVGLPFFVDAVIAPEYLAGEAPIIHLRAYGDELAAGDPIRFTVEAPSLAMATTVDGEAFEAVRVPLPELPLGEHELTIAAERPDGDPALADSMIRRVAVVSSRLRTLQSSTDDVPGTLSPPGGDGLTTYLVSDGGRGRLLPILEDLAWSTSARFDAALAAEVARELLAGEFSLGDASLPPAEPVDASGHPPDGLRLLPYASADLYLTAKAALVATEQIGADYLLSALRPVASDDESRERRIVALAGLAGAGSNVLGELRAIAPGELTLREQAWLGLGLRAAGDEDGARAIERAILAEHGQRLGDWVRLDIGAATPEAAETTASVLLLAASLRDPIATEMSRYLFDYPPSDYLPSLEQLGYARAAVEWLPRQPATFAWTVDGGRHEETLEPGGAFTLRLTAAQRGSFLVEELDGDVVVASAWDGPADLDQLPRTTGIDISRSVTPADHTAPDRMVRVTLDVSFGGSPLPRACYQVTDVLPSGLSPVVSPISWWGSEQATDIIGPYEVVGQRVAWSVCGGDRTDVRLGYAARVVSAGTYAWEPAVIQAIGAPSVGAATDPTTYGID